jgi:hypothetical protein
MLWPSMPTLGFARRLAMSMRAHLCLAATTASVVAAAPLSAQSSPIPELVNTGRLQSAGQSVQNWVILETGAAGVVVSPSYALANTAASKWIWQQSNGLPIGVTRTFRTTFTLTPAQVASARIAGRWATDDFGDDILVNGVSTGQTSTGFATWSDFEIANGFVAGLNTIDFVVRDVGTVAAFRAEITGFTGYDPSVVVDAVARDVAFTVDIPGQSGGSGGNGVVRDAVSREVAFTVDIPGQSGGSGGNGVVRDAVSREAAFVLVPPPCETQVLAPTIASVGYKATTKQCVLSTGGAYCAWSVVSEVSWMNVAAPSAGTGTGATITYVVAENQSLAPRTGVLRAGTSTLTVTQEPAADCNSNGVGDPADIDAGLLSDCDGNRVADGCDIAAGGAEDLDGNGVPDVCQTRDLVVEWTTTPPTNILPNLPTTVSYRVRNVGNGPVHASWVENIRLSADATIGSDTDIAAIGRVDEIIQPGAFVERAETVVVPLELVGTRRLVVALDTTNQVAEGAIGEANNVAINPSPITVDACNATNYFVAGCESASLNIPATPGDGANVEIFNGVGGGVPPTAAQIAGRVPSGVMLTPYIDYPNPGVHVTIGQNLTNFFASTTVPPAQVASIAASNFILRITALLRIERAMDREPATPQIDISIGVGSDDGYHLTIGSTFLGSVGDRGFSYSWVDVDFETEGLYPVTLLFAANSIGYSGLEFAWNTALAGVQLVPQSAMYLAASDCDRKIEFEDLAVGTVVADQYAALGMKSRVLGGGVQVTNANPTKFVPVSGTKVLADPGASPSETGLVEFTFVVPGTESNATVDRFSLFVIDAESIGSLVRAFDSYGNEIFSEQVNAGGGTQTPVTIDRIGISRVLVSLGSGSDTSAIDNICFDRPVLDCFRNELAPTTASFAFGGGNGSAVVTTAGATCPWSVETDVAWITFPSGAGGSGASGTFSYAVAPNASVAARVGTISAQDATLVVTQAGAPDCNGNGIGDPSEIAAGTTPDCNGNGVPDACDIASGAASDVDANGVPDTCQYADLVLVSVETVPSSPTATQPFELRWTVRNAGSWPVSGARVDRFLLSADAQIGGDVLLVESPRSETLAPGEEGSYSIAATAPLAQVGARRIVTALDAGDTVRETTAGNANNLSIDSAVTNIIAPPLPDLAVDMVTAPSSVQATVPFVVQYRVRNLGATPTAVPFLEEVFTSSDAVVGSDVLVKQTLQTAIVPAGAEIIRTASVVVAAAQEGVQRFVVRIDAGNTVAEFPIDDANNVAIGASPTEVTLPPRPNLTVAIVETPAPGAPGSLRSLRWTTANSGASSTTGSWVERVYASPDATIGGDTLLGEYGFSAPLGAGASVERTREVQVPAMASGYRIVVAVDAASQMLEESESDNIALAATVSEALLPDLTVAEVTAPANATADASMVVSWSVRNDGVVNATGSWVDSVYLSSDDTIGPGDRLVASRSRSGPIPTGLSYPASASFIVPSDLVGPMRVLVEADVGRTLLEPPAADTTAANSRAATNLTEIAQPERPDLVVTAAATPSAGLIGAAMSVQYTVTNQGGSAATGTWTDRIVARNTATQAETYLGDVIVATTVAGNGGSYVRTLACSYPLAEGTYQLRLTTDHGATLLEDVLDGELNNTWTSASTWAVGTFTVSASTAFVEGPIPQTVTISGMATVGASANPVGGVPVRVRVGVRGTERQLPAVTAPDGSYAVAFDALPNEAGVYTVRAGPVGEQAGPVQDTFTLFAGRLEGPAGWQTIYPGTGQVTGTLVYRNLGDAGLTGLALETGSGGDGIDLDVSLPASTLAPLASMVLPFTATADADATGNREIQLTVRSAQGTVSTAVLRFFVTPAQPSLVLTPGNLSGTMVIPPSASERTQVFYNCTVRNGGAGIARNVRVVLPQGAESWLSVVGSAHLGDIGPGAEAGFVLQVSPPPGLAFGPYSGTIGVLADNASAQLSFAFQAMSSATGTLVIDAADERTYYQTENPPYPPLAGAYVEVRDSYTGLLVASGTTQESGRLVFTGLPESYYRVRAIATDHGDFEGNTLVRPGQSTIVSAYLPEQFVSYTWTVTPTTIDDEYDITIDLEFETNVPFPVVTLQPGYVDIEDVLQGQQFGQIIYTIRNHGLVDAEDVTFQVGDHPRYRLTPLITDVGILNGVPPGTPDDACVPGSCVQIPVIVEDLAFEGGVAGVNCDQIVAVVRHWKECGIERSFESRAVVRIPGCPVPPPVCPDCPPPQPPNCPGCPDWDPPIFRLPPQISLALECEQCCNETSHPEPSKWEFSFNTDFIKQAIQNFVTLPLPADAISVSSKLKWESDYCCERVQEGCVRQSSRKVKGEARIALQTWLLGGEISFNPELSLPIDLGFGDVVNVAVAPSVKLQGGVQLSGGGEARLERGIGCDGTGCIKGQGQVFAQGQAILSAQVGDKYVEIPEFGHPVLVKFVAEAYVRTRVEISFDYNQANCEEGFVVVGCFEGLIAVVNLQATVLGQTFQFCREYVIAAPVSNPPNRCGDIGCPDPPSPPDSLSGSEDAIANTITALEGFVADFTAREQELETIIQDEPSPPQSGLCASVSVQLSQEIAIARAAFEAELELSNSSTTDSLDAVEIDLFVRDLEGNRADNKFFLTQPIVEGIGGVDGSDSLSGGQTCSARWTLIPSDLAAEQGPTQYFVSGTLSYIRGESTTTVPLFPVAILVMPNPSLHLKYFIEEVVYGDDPFTPEIEPSIPFDLGLLVRNEGSGEARNVRMVSSQPRIVENSQSLLIDFQLLGTRLGLQPLTPNLAVHLGNIPADGAQTVRWIMLSSLQGRFVDYEATIESRNGFGDPSLSLVDSVEIFPLTHVVRALGDVRDRLPDFLVDEIPDAQDLADRLHRSDGPVDPVVAVTSGVVERDDLKLEATVQVAMPTGWAYIRLDDPFENAYRLAAVERGDGTQLLLGDNAWQTSRVSRPLGAPPVAERRVHIFDSGGEGAYRLIYEPDSVAPRVISWASLRQHGLDGAALRFGSGKLATEPRTGGCEELLVSFDEPVRRSTFGDSAVVVTAYDEGGVEVDAGSTVSVQLAVGERDARLIFDPPLANDRRYCIRLVGVTDLAGNLLVGGADRLDLAVLKGDLSGDARVTVNDAGAIAGLLGVPFDPSNALVVRADIDRNGLVEMADLMAILADIGADLRTVGANPCAGGVLADGEGGGVDVESFDASTVTNILDLIGRDRSAGQDRRGVGGTALAEGARQSIVLSVGPASGDAVRGLVRLDMLVLHGAELQVIFDVAEAFGLEVLGRPMTDVLLSGAVLVQLPQGLWTPEASQMLAFLLEGQSVSAAVVLEDAGGRLAVMHPGVAARIRAGGSADALAVMLDSLPCVGAVDVSEANLLRWSCPGWGLHAVSDLMRRLAAASTVEEAWIQLVPLDGVSDPLGDDARQSPNNFEVEVTP